MRNLGCFGVIEQDENSKTSDVVFCADSTSFVIAECDSVNFAESVETAIGALIGAFSRCKSDKDARVIRDAILAKYREWDRES